MNDYFPILFPLYMIFPNEKNVNKKTSLRGPFASPISDLVPVPPHL